MSTKYIEAYQAELEAMWTEHWRKVVALEKGYDAALQKFVDRLELSGIEVDTSEDTLHDIVAGMDANPTDPMDRIYSVDVLTNAVGEALKQAIDSEDGSDLEHLLEGASIH
jgi:hypothetical protein